MDCRYIPVSERALIARVNRKLSKEYKRIRKTRPDSRARYNLGIYYLLNHLNNIIDSGFNLEAMADKCGVLHEREFLSTESN